MRQKAIFYPGEWEPCHLHGTLDEMARMRLYDGLQWPKAGGVLIDAGASIGLVSAQLQPQAQHVYAIEADPAIFGVLVRNVTYNRWRNVTPFSFALADYDGTAVLHREVGNPFGASILMPLSQDTVTVTAKRLSTFMREQGIERVDVLKLDVEGAEHAIVAEESFADVAPRIGSILMECHYLDVRPTLERIRDLGFRDLVHPFGPKSIVAFRRC